MRAIATNTTATNTVVDALSLIASKVRGQTGAAQELDLQGANLAGADLNNLDLSGVNLEDANLSGASLFKTNLREARLSRANLHGAELTGADLTDAYLEEADLSSAGLGMACLHRVHGFQANLQNCTLTKANLHKADLRGAQLQQARLREANLSHADLTNTQLQAADLSLSTVHGAIFTNADLRDAQLGAIQGYDKAEWIGIDLRDINFVGAYRMRRFIIDQNYLKEFREHSPFTRFLYGIWQITSDCGRSPLRWCLWVLLTACLYAGAYTLVGIDYGPYETWLSPFYFSVVTMTTLGFGDALPMTVSGQIIAMLAVTNGYILLGGLLSIFSNKIARRGE